MTSIRVRICVVTNIEGKYVALGWTKGDDQDTMAQALDMLGEPGLERVSWVEADVPLPDVTTIEGKVTE